MADLLKSLSVAALLALGAVAAQAQTAPSTETATEPETPAEAAPSGESATPPAQEPAPESAQEPAPDAAQAPAVDGVNSEGLNLGQEVGAEAAEGGVGATYVQSEHGDWQLRCVRTAEGDDPCQLYQLLSDADGNAVAEISMFGLPAGQQAAAGATVITPLETLLTSQLTLAVDGGTAKRYPFTFCAAAGCFARIGFTGPDIATFKAGNRATLTIVPAAAPDEEVELVVSLSGFTAGFDAVNRANGN